MSGGGGDGGGIDGVQRDGGGRGAAGARGPELGLRILAMVLTVTAAVVMGVVKQTKTVPVPLGPGLPPIFMEATAKSTYSSAYVYFVVANALASAFTLLSTALAVTNRRGSGAFIDVIMVALLFSANGAAMAVGTLGYKGNSHLRWNKVCNVFGKFCHGVLAAILLSTAASFIYVLLALLASRRSK